MDINSDGLISFTTRHPWHLEESSDLIHWHTIASGNPNSKAGPVRVFYQTSVAPPVSGSDAHQGFFRLAEFPVGHLPNKKHHHKGDGKGAGHHKGHEQDGHQKGHDKGHHGKE